MLAHAIESDRREAMRHPVDYPLFAAHARRGDVKLRIVNISTAGFMANGDVALTAGERVTLRLPVIGEIEAHMVWADATRVGFRFERIVRLGDFTRLFVAMQPPRR
jgi:hypothetical protein